jgi:D-alanyl-D-alanine endopeptidase (penicillin-binding protein 7)
VVADSGTGRILYEKEADRVRPVASLTKIMSAMVLLDSHLSLAEPVTIEEVDVDTLKKSASHLPVGWALTRGELLRIALTASDNRAAHALARTYPGGTEAFVAAMNRKAGELGMRGTRYVDPTGLDPRNVSTARDLLRLAEAAGGYGSLCDMSTAAQLEVVSRASGKVRCFGNSNGLVHDSLWSIGLTKTGYIAESGYCLLMKARIGDRPFTFVFLGAAGKDSRLGDARRARSWLLGNGPGAGGKRGPFEGGRAGREPGADSSRTRG